MRPAPRILPAKAASPTRQAVRQPKPQSVPQTFPAPMRGLVEGEFPPQPGGASVLENFIPTPNGCRVRGGSQPVATLPDAVLSMFDYDDGAAVQRLFAASESGIYDVSALDGSPGVLAVSQLPVEWTATQFRTVGGLYLYAVCGAGDPQLFDGTSWQAVTASSTPISITGATGPFSSVFNFKSRLFFVRANSMTVYFLPVGQVGGAALDLNLAGVFHKGGRILFGASWSSDSGSGFADRLVLVTDMGEVAVFEGSDPASAADWGKVGQYVIPRPLGINAWMRSGGDLLIATAEGIITMSAVVGNDISGLAASSLTRTIFKSWAEAAEANKDGWQLARWDTARVMLALRPASRVPVWGRSMETGAWFHITPWDCQTAAMHKGRLYFGGKSGVVSRGDTTGQDNGMPVIARYRGLLEQGHRNVTLCRLNFRSNVPEPAYALKFIGSAKDKWSVTPRPWGTIENDALWGVGLWDAARWSGTDEIVTVSSAWRSGGRSSGMVAPEVVIVSDALLPISAEILTIDAMVEPGGIVT